MSVPSAKIIVKKPAKQKTKKHPWKKPFLAGIVGPIASGKSSAVLAIMKELDDHFDQAIFYSGNGMDRALDDLSPDVMIIRDRPDELMAVLDTIETDQKARKMAGIPLERILLVIDDAVASGDIFKQGRGRLNHFILSLRHLNTSIIVTTQQWTMLPRIVRTNVNLWFIFKMPDGDQHAMLSELPFPKRFLERAYSVATRDRHSFLYANLDTRSLHKGFDEEIT